MTPIEIKERAWKIAHVLHDNPETLTKAIQILCELIAADPIIKIHLVVDYADEGTKYFLTAHDLSVIYHVGQKEWEACPGERCKHKSWPHFGPNHEGELK